MIGRQIKAAVLAAVVALGFVFGAASAAQAATGEYNYAEPRTYSSHWKDCVKVDRYEACVQPYGDLIWMKDFLDDNYETTISWKDMDGDRYGSCYNRQGPDAGWTACNKNFPEGHTIRWKFYWRNYDGSYESSAYQYTDV